MLTHLSKAFEQLSDPPVRGTVVRSVVAAVTLFIMLLAGAFWLVTSTALFEAAWLEWTVDILGGLVAVALAWLMFPAVVVAVSSLMLDRVVGAAEQRWYPHLGPPRNQGLGETLGGTLRFVLIVVALNLLALPLIFVPVVGQVVYYGLNGYLLGREFFEMVALRRLPPAEMRAMRERMGLRVTMAGLLIAVLATLPLINLTVPVVAAIFMVHLFEEARRDLQV